MTGIVSTIANRISGAKFIGHAKTELRTSILLFVKEDVSVVCFPILKVPDLFCNNCCISHTNFRRPYVLLRIHESALTLNRIYYYTNSEFVESDKGKDDFQTEQGYIPT